MASTTNSTPLLDGPRRSAFLTIVLVVLSLITIDGVLTGLAGDEADDSISALVASNPDRYPTGLDDSGQLLSSADADQLARATNGDRLDRDLITTKTWLVVIGLIASIALALSAGPGSSRNLLTAVIIVAGVAYFVPLLRFSDAIDIVTTAHGG